MTRLPTPGSDSGQWGEILNEFLSQAHTADGQLKTDSVTAGQLAPGSVVTPVIADGSVTQSKLHSAVQSSLGKADTAVQPVDLGTAATLEVGTTPGTVAAGDDSRITGATQKSSNLSDLADAATARANLGLGQIITVGPGGDHATIQAAIDTADDSAGSPVTILIYPGTYARFSMLGWPHQTGDWSGNVLRHISLIAIGDVTVQDDAGDYRTPPAEIRTNGIIKGIKFVATHNTPFVDPIEEALVRRSYAVHLDWDGGQDVTFEDCQLISAHAPGAGIGLHQDERIAFRRCLLPGFRSWWACGWPEFGG